MDPSSRPTDTRLRLALKILSGLIAVAVVLLLVLPQLRRAPERAANPLPQKPQALAPPSIGMGEDDPPVADSELRREIGDLLNLGGSGLDAKQVRTLLEFEGKLSDKEVDSLLRVILTGGPADANVSERARIVHLVTNLLHDQVGPRRDFAEVLGHLAGNPGQPVMIRDYAIQHLARMWNAAGSPEQHDLRQSIRLTIAGLAGNDGTVGNAALLSLHLLGAASRPDRPSRYDVSDDQLLRLIGPAIDNPTASLDRRLAAVRIAGERGFHRYHPVLRTIGTDPSAHSMLRKAAISAIGRVGSLDQDEELLRRLATAEPEYRIAVDYGLKRLKTRDRQ